MDARILDGFTLFHHLEALRQWELGAAFAPILVEIHPLAPAPEKTPLPGPLLLQLIRDLGTLRVPNLLIAGPDDPLDHPETLAALHLATESGMRATLITRKHRLSSPAPFRVLPPADEPSPSEAVRTYDRCLGLPFIALVRGDGSVTACSDPQETTAGACGTLHQADFATLWAAGQTERERLSRERNPRTACPTSCRHHGINQALWRHIHPPEHTAFI
ncbi:MAG: hypothetical protein HQM00_14590 [Magnetococcales bacterium]|nr:hypothetical protein [Magnetococcales bacterium]